MLLSEECQLLAISVLLPVRFILILNHRRDSLIFGSEALRIPCGAWAPRGHGRNFSCFCARNCCQFQSEEWGCLCLLWGQAESACVRVASFSFPHPRPSHQVSPPGSRGSVPHYSRRARGVVLWNTARGESRPSGQQGNKGPRLSLQCSVSCSSPSISYTVHTWKDFSSNQTKRMSLPEWHSKKDQRKDNAPMLRTVVQTVCQSRIFTRGTVVGTSHQISLCCYALNKCVIGDCIASDYIVGWARLRCLGWWP